MGFGYFKDQYILHSIKNVLFEVSCNYNKLYDMYRIAKVSIQLIYRDTIQSPSYINTTNLSIVDQLFFLIP